MPTRASKPRQGENTEKDQCREGQAVQYEHLQDPLYTRLCRYDPEVWDDGFIQYPDSKSAHCIPDHIAQLIAKERTHPHSL